MMMTMMMLIIIIIIIIETNTFQEQLGCRQGNAAVAEGRGQEVEVQGRALFAVIVRAVWAAGQGQGQGPGQCTRA